MSEFGALSVIFDLDGTLVDSEPNYYEASRQVLAEHGVPDFGWADHEGYVGIGTRETVTLWRERYDLPVPAAQLLAALDRRYLELARRHTRAYPEMRAFVELLASADVPMAVASGSSPDAMEAILTGTGLAAHLRTAVSAEEVRTANPLRTSSWRRPAGSARTRPTAWSWRTRRPAWPPPTRPACAASRSRTSPPRRTRPSSPPRPCCCGAARRNSRPGRRMRGCATRRRDRARGAPDGGARSPAGAVPAPSRGGTDTWVAERRPACTDGGRPVLTAPTGRAPPGSRPGRPRHGGTLRGARAVAPRARWAVTA